MSLLIGAWVPESPHWLIRVGRLQEARQSLAWALMIDPKEIQLPAVAPPVENAAWRELFKYPRSIVAGCLIGLTQTGGIGFVLLLHVTPVQTSGLVIWLSAQGKQSADLNHGCDRCIGSSSPDGPSPFALSATRCDGGCFWRRRA